jgi:hypothetical protein
MTLLDADQKIELDDVLGEDTWELFEVIEDSFGIDLGDYRSLCGMSVAELANKVRERTTYPVSEICLSAAAFYRLRRAFVIAIGLPRKEIHPSTQIAKYLPWWRRSRTLWQSIEQSLELKMPNLVPPRWASFVALILPAALMLCLRRFLGLPLSAFMIFAGSVLLTFPAMAALVPAARVLPPTGETFGGLAKIVLARNHAAFASHCGGSSEKDVLLSLRQIVAGEVGVSIEEITPEVRVPQDLNIY